MAELQNELSGIRFRDILLFSAVVGYRNERRVSFITSGEPIRYDTLVQPGFSEAVINMIAANVVADDPEIMDAARLEERIQIFEEYANGSLEYIQEQVNTRARPVASVVLNPVPEALSESGAAKPASVDEMLRGATWG
ncbi:hypothetical protein ACFXKD_21375 [Nocardiopsis aegyptia]|uniref:hypothetical protein n=1 Tax=Nocardiopsis aegyptia TaxID=220378 RepID=UPI00366F980E